MNSGYRDGYEKNKSNAETGKDRDMRPPLIKAVVSETYRKDYSEGAKDGYRDGMQKKS